jgi:phage terminase large subunit-like protein
LATTASYAARSLSKTEARDFDMRRVKHVAPPKEELEDQMCDFGLGGLSPGASPDRLDALVWAVAELTAKVWPGPRIRAL